MLHTAARDPSVPWTLTGRRRPTPAQRLRPADAGRGRLEDEHLSRSRRDDVLDSLGAAPVRREHEQRPTVGAAEHGREARAAEVDPFEHFTALADAGAVVCHVRARGPDAAVRVEADAVRPDPVGPDATVRQGAVAGDVEGGEPGGERLGDDERLVVGRDDHAVREGELVRHLAGLAVRADERDLAGCFAAREHLVELGKVEVDRVHVDVAAPIDGDLTPTERRYVVEIGVSDARSVGLDPDQLRARDEQTSVWEPVRRPPEPVWAFSHNLARAVEIDGDDLSRPPVREPQTAVVPTRRLGHGQAVEQYARLHAPPSFRRVYRLRPTGR